MAETDNTKREAFQQLLHHRLDEVLDDLANERGMTKDELLKMAVDYLDKMPRPQPPNEGNDDDRE